MPRQENCLVIFATKRKERARGHSFRVADDSSCQFLGLVYSAFGSGSQRSWPYRRFTATVGFMVCRLLPIVVFSFTPSVTRYPLIFHTFYIQSFDSSGQQMARELASCRSDGRVFIVRRSVHQGVFLQWSTARHPGRLTFLISSVLASLRAIPGALAGLQPVQSVGQTMSGSSS